MAQAAIDLSIVSPVYNSAEIIPVLVQQLANVCEKISPSFQIILVDDGSADSSWEAIKSSQQNYPVVACKMRKNVGQHYAIHAGLSLATGRRVIVMDCDLQDNPMYIPALLEASSQQNTSVLAYRNTKQNDPYYVISSYLLNTMLYLLHGQKYHYRTGNFGVYTQTSVQKILQLPVRNFYLPVAVRTIENGVPHIMVEHQQRYAGKSAYRFKTQFNLALQALRYGQSGKLTRSNSIMPYTVEKLIYPKFDE